MFSMYVIVKMSNKVLDTEITNLDGKNSIIEYRYIVKNVVGKT